MSDTAAEFDLLCDALASLLDGPGRREIVERVTRGGRRGAALRRLRTSMAGHGFEGLPRDFARTVRRLDTRTRSDGFRVLHTWNHTQHRFTDELTPVLMVDFFERSAPEGTGSATTASILLDYYLLHLLALGAMRVWDTPEPGAALDRITGLLELLQGRGGSGHRFVADAETLLIHALSQFHPEEQAYDRLIERVDGLPRGNRLRFARVSAAVLGAHLRWGFWLMYDQDVQRMRDDNVGDYPWLLWTLTTLLRAWAEPDPAGEDAADPGPTRAALGGSLLLGLAADPWALGGPAPAALEPFGEMYDECRALLDAHGESLLETLEAHRPTKTEYAPLAFLFNFPHNALVAAVTVALLEGRPRTLGLNDLFEEGDVATRESSAGAGSAPGEEDRPAPSKERLARTLTAFSRGRPDRLGHRGAMLVAYDPLTALRTYSMTVKVLREGLG